jgi:hypothetical protein
MRITNTGGCPVADCPVDLGPNCAFDSFAISSAWADLVYFRPCSFEGAIRQHWIPSWLQEVCCILHEFFADPFLTEIVFTALASLTWMATRPTPRTAALVNTAPPERAHPLVSPTTTTSVRLLHISDENLITNLVHNRIPLPQLLRLCL